MSPSTDPAPLRHFFDGTALSDKQHLAAYLVTIDDEGLPHAAMISAGELLLDPDGSARLALWPGSRTRANLAARGHATLLVVLEGVSVRARLHLREAAAQPLPELTTFVGSVHEVSADTAPYATLEDGVRFTLHDPDEALERWGRVIGELRKVDPR